MIILMYVTPEQYKQNLNGLTNRRMEGMKQETYEASSVFKLFHLFTYLLLSGLQLSGSCLSGLLQHLKLAKEKKHTD